MDERTERSRGMTLELSNWFYDGVMMKGGVLSIDRAAPERALLLLVITEMSPPAGAIWANVAERLGRGLNGNACRYYALIELFFFISELLTCS